MEPESHPKNLSRRVRTVIGCALAASALASVGCASTALRSEFAFFPPPPAAPRVVHLLSFNRLSEVSEVRTSWIDVLRGSVPSPTIGTPAGIAFRDGHLYVCDTSDNTVHDWDLNGGRAQRVGVSDDDALSKPVAVTVDDQGTFYVADTERGEVLAFGPGGAQADPFRPDDRKDFRPVGVSVQGSTLYVADIVSHAIEVFDTTSGEHLRSIGAAGSAQGQFYYPTGLAFDNEAHIVVADLMNARVQVIGTDGESVLSFGRPGNRYGDMGKPKRVAVGPDGVIFVADPEFAHVHLFDERGRLLMLIGGPGNDAGSTPLPAGVAVAETLPPRLSDLVPHDFDARYFLFVSNSMGERRISLFAIGQPR